MAEIDDGSIHLLTFQTPPSASTVCSGRCPKSICEPLRYSLIGCCFP